MDSRTLNKISVVSALHLLLPPKLVVITVDRFGSEAL
jgi:hypothetical protein